MADDKTAWFTKVIEYMGLSSLIAIVATKWANRKKDKLDENERVVKYWKANGMDFLSRLEAVEKENAEIKSENAEIKSENATLKLQYSLLDQKYNILEGKYNALLAEMRGRK